jgi:hypothetical protein
VVKVLVGKKNGDGFPGFWAEFEGTEVDSYERTRRDKKIVYTLYKCTVYRFDAYRFDAYRVHTADENDPANPVYELPPYSEYPDSRGLGLDFSEPYTKDQLAAAFPLFLKDMDYFPERYIDPPG